MRTFAQAQEIFDGDQTTRQPKDDIDGNETTQLQPGEGGAVYAKPHCLPHDDVGIGGRVIGKAAMKEIDNGKHGASNRQQSEDEETPTRPNVWKGLCDQQEQTAPTKKDQYKRREKVISIVW